MAGPEDSPRSGEGPVSAFGGILDDPSVGTELEGRQLLTGADLKSVCGGGRRKG